MTNEQIVQKAAMAMADLQGDAKGGYLNPMQSDRFIRGILDQPTIIRAARSIIIDGDSKKIEKIGFGSRIMRAATENVALDSSAYAKPTTSKVTLLTKEVIAETRISYDTLEVNIERGTLKQTILQMIQERCALDLEELILQGDTTNVSDTYLAVLDGVLTQITSHVVDGEGEEIGLGLWTDLIKGVPNKYLRFPDQWRIYTSRNLDLAWKNKIAARATAAGDRFLLDGTNATALGYKIEQVAMVPDDGATTTPVATGLSQALLIHPQNIVVGFSRKVQIETDRDISARQIIIVTTLKVDVKLEEEDACAKLINIDSTITDA